MFIVLRRKQLKRHLCIALFLIFTGMALSNPFVAKADNNLVYLYPYITNNPVEQSGLFWLESNPELGAYNLSVWQQVLKNKQIVVGIPEERFTMGASIVGDNLGNYIVHKLKKKLSGSQKETTPPPPGKYDKDKFSYKRTINGNTEEISVEVGKHFENNEKWKEFMDVVKEHLTDNELLKQPMPDPTSIPNNENNESAKMIGNTMALGGLALLVRVLMIAIAL